MYEKKWKEYGIPCICGKSSDAFALDVDGGGFCFRGDCNKYFSPKDLMNEEEYTIDKPNGSEEIKFFSHRGLSLDTLQLYQIKTKFIDNEPYETGFYYPSKKGFKFRRYGDVPKKERFYSTEGMNSPGLYGKDFFDPGSKESITITEGMYDAPSVYELSKHQTAGVAVSSSGSALRDITQDRDYVNSFKKIYICMDNDGPGEEATRAIVTSGLFDYNKLYIVKYNHFKDPNEYLTENAFNEFNECWKNARRYTPDNIISTFSEIEESLRASREDQIGTYPYKKLNDMTYGIHAGEIIVVKAPSGVGKTEFFRATEYHNLKTTKHPIGIIHLEEDNGTTVKAIAGYELEVPATLPDCHLSTKEIMDGFRKAVSDDEGRVHLYSSFESEEIEILLDNIRFLASVAGCKLIFFDHMTWMGTGREDYVLILERLSQKLKLLAKELKIAIIEISHVNDDGRTSGSRNIAKVANTIIVLSRDLTAFDPVVKRTTNFMLEKVRLGGNTGPAGSAVLDTQTGKLIDSETEI